jgi:hypothetical protein
MDNAFLPLSKLFELVLPDYYNHRMNRYKHALALYPYFGHSTTTMGIFPPTGLEYIVASMKDLVDKVTLILTHHNR